MKGKFRLWLCFILLFNFSLFNLSLTSFQLFRRLRDVTFSLSKPEVHNQLVRSLNVFKVVQDWEIPQDENKKKIIDAEEIRIPDLMNFIKDNPELLLVLIGQKGITSIKKGETKLEDIKKAFWAYRFVTGRSVYMVKVKNRYYVYNENVLRAKLFKHSSTEDLEKRIAATRMGLELLIKRDLLRKSGEFYDELNEMGDDAIKIKAELNDLINNFENNGLELLQDEEQGPKYLVMLTFDRPGALDRALKIYTKNLDLFGHKDIEILIFDDTRSDSENGRKNAEVIRKYSNDFKIRHITPEKRADFVNELIDNLWDQVSSTSSQSYASFKGIMQNILQARNIGSARTFSILVTEGKMFNVDDDSLPFAMVPEENMLNDELGERESTVEKAKEKMYNELNVSDESEFEEMLKNWDNLNEDQKSVLKKYYAYYPNRKTGLIPEAGGEILSSEINYNDVNDSQQGKDGRIRFGRFFQEAFRGKRIINTEDSLFVPMRKDADGKPLANFGLIPVDFISAFKQTLGKKVGDPEVGYVFTKDWRGMGGILNLNTPERKKIAMVAGHFNNARDLSAEWLMREALNYWEKTGKVDIKDVQQVVRQTLHIDVNGSTSTESDRVNQYCFNVTSMDLSYPIPTLGGWLRIEEPFFKELVEVITGETMAWSGVVGGHRRIPAERRPRVDRQALWEEMAMLLWPFLDKILNKINEPGLNTEEKFREAGNELLDLKDTLTLVEDGKIKDAQIPQIKEILASRERMTGWANQFWKKAKDLNDKNVVGGYKNVQSTQDELRNLAIRIAQQFELAKYVLKYDPGRKELIWYREESAPREFDWITGKENFGWGRTDQGRVALLALPDRKTEIYLGKEKVEITREQWRELRSGEIEFFFASDGEKIEFLGKVQEYIRQQLEYDGYLLLYWPELKQITDVLRNRFSWIPK